MSDAKSIANLGLGKIGATRVTQLTPPKTVVEGLIASGFQQWKDSELKKRRWVFATVLATLSPTGISPIAGLDLPYQFALPGDILRPLRPALPLSQQWVQRGQFLYSRNATLKLEYIQTVADNLLTDVSFIDVLAWRIAQEMVEPETQSNEKQIKADNGYLRAVNDAYQLNAWVLDPQPTGGYDEDYAWIDNRLTLQG